MSKESNKIASNTITQIFGRVVVLILSLVSIKLITNYLGTQGTGYYSTIVNYFSFVIVIADFGLFSVVVREVSRNPGRAKELFHNTFSIRFISAIIATAIALLAVFFTHYPHEIKLGLLYAALFPIFNLAGSVYDMLFQYKLEMKKVVYAEVISKIVVVGLVYYFAKTNTGYYSIVWTISIAAFLMFLIKAFLSRKELPLSFRLDKTAIKEIIQMSAPLGIVFIVNNIYFKIDSLMVFYFKGAGDAGIYAVAYRVLETTLFVGSYLTSSLKPLLSVSLIQDKPKAESAISTAIIYLLFMAIALGIINFCFSKEIILFLSNADFLPGALAIFILGFVPAFMFISGILGEILIAKDLRREMIWISAFIICFNVILNLILIPRYSYYGAAVSTVLSEIVLMLASLLIARRVISVNFNYKKIFKLFLAGGFSVLIAFSIKETTNIYFLFNLAIMLAFYVLFAYYTEAIPVSSLDNYLLSLKKKWIN